MTDNRFDAILVDFYGTISGGDREAVERACRRVVSTCGLPVSAPAFARIWGECFFRIIDQSNHADFRTLYECELDSLRETLASFGRNHDPVPFVAELEQYWTAPPIHEDAIRFLETVGMPLCCVSNADTAPLTAAIKGNGLVFDAVVTSEDARCYKPEAAIFERALARMGVKPDRALHVGDSLHSDIGGAAAIGITTVWVCREDRIHDIGTCQADFQVSSLRQLKDLFDGVT